MNFILLSIEEIIMNNITCIIELNNITDAEKGKYAEELKNILLLEEKDIIVNLKRKNSNSQDFGSTLIILLTSATAVSIVKVIGQWLTKRNSVELTVKRNKNEIILKNITAKDVHQILEKFNFVNKE